MNLAVVVTGALCIPQIAAFAQDYDLVIRGGRVIDPETSLDARRNVGIRGKTIAAVTGDAISGRETIDATGLVVAPGFIDLHAHGQNAESRLLQAADGVTTALELEIGVYPVKPWYESQAGPS
ncbi:MAG: amidohydrolase family protein, partial [Candidatus Hydrogenedentota bacterium]